MTARAAAGLLRCERCGRPVEMEERADVAGYLCTGRCRACRVGVTGWVGMMENLRDPRT